MKQEQAIQLNIGGIKCDTKGCDYNDMSVKVQDYEGWLNKPCPECGGNLLTQADYDNVQQLLVIASMMNFAYPAPSEDDEIVTASIEMDGTGKMDINIK